MQIKKISPCSDWLSYQEVSQLTGLKRNTLLRMIERGEFPAPVRINRQIVKFSLNTVQDWIKSKEDCR